MKRLPPCPVLLVAALGVAGLLTARTPAHAQTNAAPGFMIPYKRGNVTVFRASGRSMRMLSATVYEVPDFRLETFNSDGTPNLVGEAPHCIFNLGTTNASSGGKLTVTQVGGGLVMSGYGFNWDHAAQRLQMSNRFHAVFRLKSAGALVTPPK